ncbi:YDG domain-containing protein [Janthinobacterium sp. MDB2-8]|uniref:YDG domain-containing protein n=1 Tax=Janthinobacterium sp. MDB2-8 TaxID=1259338 RepID=UPI003F24AAF8
MNRIYRLIWSHVHQAWVIVPERTKGKGKTKSRTLVASALLAVTQLAMAGPTGGQVTAGNGSISQNGATTTVTQASQNLSLNWTSFNTGSQETVNFVQPSASAIAVNRISDTNGTQFFGQLNANGQVYLINPNGVLFGAGSHINVGGLVASTLDISDADINGAMRHFSGSGTGSIINQGTINAAHGGYVAFIGNTVSNQGSINAAAGAVALGAGSDVTLAFSGDSLVNLEVKQSTLNNLAENGGLIKADGGAVWLSAGARDAVLASVINNTGIVQARSVQNVNGSIVLAAGSAGTATNSGTLDASGSGGARGGSVKVLGGTVKLAAGSAIDVSGDGGGTALVGGNFLGSGSEQRAHTTTVDAGASIKADAITSGNGGNVAVWSDGSTQFNGSITARGGSTAGNGGQVETSGKVLNIKESAAVSTAAPHGKAGDWLLDPDDITIGNLSIWGNSYGVNVDERVLVAALNNGNVTIKTGASKASCTGITCTPSGSGNGDIVVLDRIGAGIDYDKQTNIGANWSNNTTLTLSAYRNILFKLTNNVPYKEGTGDFGGGIIASGPGNVVLKTDNTAKGVGTLLFEDPSQNFIYLNGSASTLAIYYNPDSYGTPTDFSPYIYVNNASQLKTYMAINTTGSVASKTYDGNTTASISGLTSLLSMPAGLTLNSSGAQANFSDKNAGTGKTVTISGVTVTGSGASSSTTAEGSAAINYGGNNYYINGLDSKTATITAKTISASGVAADNKTYDGTTTATLSGGANVASGIVSGDSVSLSGGTATFADANAGASKAVTVTGFGLSGSDAGNYLLTQPTGLTATIHKADLILSGGKTYDGNTAVAGGSLTATGVAGQTFSVGGAGDASNLASKNVQAGTALGSAAGLVLGGSGNGGLSSNYNVLGTAGSSYTVTAKGITLTGIGAVDKTYDATTTATLNTANVAYSGMIAGDNVSLGGQGVGSFASKDAGANKTVSVSGFSLGGLDAGNYVVTQPSGLTATISKADLLVSGISAGNKTYDAGTGATLSGSASVTALLSDNVSVVGTGSGSFADANAGSGKSVAVSGYALTGSDAANYNVVQPSSVTATIHKADLILSGGKTYDGNTAVAGATLTATGVAGQTFSVTGSGDASNLASKNVQAGTALGSATGLVLGSSGNGGLSSNYNVLGTAGSSYTVTAKGITLTGIGAVDKTYDATTTATLNTTNVAYSGMIAGDNVSLGGQGVGSFASKDAGANKTVSVSGFSLGGLDAGNYVVTQPSGLTATISKADLLVSGISAVNKTYDAGTSATLSGTAAVSGLLSDNVSVVGTGSGSFADANAGSGKSVAVSGYALTGSDAANYNVVQPSSVTATIHKADLLLSGGKTYDGNTAVAGATLTATGVAGQTFSVTGSGDASNLASKNVQAGTALGSATGLVLGSSGNGGLSSNYNVLGTAGSSYTVTAKGITLTGIGAVDKTYDATTTATLNTANVGYSGMIAGDDVSLGGQGVGSFASKDAGANKSVSVSGFSLGGLDAGNYVVTQPSGLTATISKAELVVSGISAGNKTYDAGTGATLSGSASVTALLSDNVSVVGTGSGSFADANAGSGKSVAVSGYALTGSDAANYNVVQPSSVTATIHKADLILSGGKTYDGNTAVAGATLTATGVAGQTFSVSGAGDASNLASKNVQAGTALGSATGLVLGSSGNGGLSSNYNVLGTAGSSYTVTAKGITLTGIGVVDKTYDATTTATLNTANVAYSGMIAGDNVSLGGQGVGSFASKDAGANKSVSVSGFSLSGLDAGNYVVTQPTGLTATISKAELVVSGISAGNKTYDAGTGATLSGTAAVSGLLSDNVSVVGVGSGSFADANAGSGKSVAVTGYALTGSDAANYNVVQPSSVTATIHKADLILSGGKTYDGNTAVAGGSLTATGVAGETFSVSGAGDASNLTSKNVQAGTALGSAAGLVLGSSGNGGLSGNYNVLGTAGSSYTVTAKGITLTGINAVDKTYDATTTAGLNTTNVAYSGMIAGDNVSLGGQGVGSFASKDAGANKTVSVSGFSLSGLDAGNYVVTQPSGLTATISKAELVVSGISAADKTYDATTTASLNAAHVAYSGIFAEDNVSLGGQGVGQFSSKDAGANKAVAVSGYILTGADAGNYVVRQPTGLTASIRKADLSLTGLIATDKVYDATTTAALAGSASLSGVMGSDSVSLGGTQTATFADKNVGKNKSVTVSGYALAGSDAGNYTIADRKVLTASITPASMTVSGITAADKVYDGSTAATVNAGNATLAGKLGSDVITITSTGLFSDAAAGAGKTVNLSSVYGGADIGNYTIAGQSRAVASITAAPVVVPTTPGVSSTQMQQIQNTVTQVQSSVLPPQASAQPQVLNLSSTLLVQQTDAGTNRAGPAQETAGTRLLNTSTGFGTSAPTLQIQNGGMQLPLVANSLTE